ncbi:MAG: two-component regulator propeller domain-containing protein [Pyrinomonadaceae bacterium]
MNGTGVKGVSLLRSLLCALLCTLMLPHHARGERLPVKAYTIADGLPHDSVRCVVQDARGLMWFCTSAGLARFDGYAFKVFTTEQGLPSRFVNGMLAARDGRYWLATGDGLCLFDPRAPALASAANAALLPDVQAGASPRAPKFTVFRPAGVQGQWLVNAVFEDQAGTVWCTDGKGLYRLAETREGRALVGAEVGLVKEKAGDEEIFDAAADRAGAVWLATRNGLYRYWPGGRTERFTTAQGLPVNDIGALFLDRAGRLLVGTTRGLCRLVAAPDPGARVVERVYTTRDGLPDNWVRAIFRSADGTLWVVPSGGAALSELRPGDQSFHTYTAENGLNGELGALGEDRDGNLWLGTSSGALKLTRHGLTTYGRPDGIAQPRINSIAEDRTGTLYVVGFDKQRLLVDRFDGRHFRDSSPLMPTGTGFSWGWNQVVLQDHTGEWWVASALGVYRFQRTQSVERLGGLRPKAKYTTREGLTADEVFRLFEDARGDIWIGTITLGQQTLTRWERATETFHRYATADGIPPSAPTAFCNDRAGALWIGFYGGGFARYRDGRFELFGASEGEGLPGLPAGYVSAIYADQAGRLWVAVSSGGLLRVDNPGAEHPRFTAYTSAQGLSTDGAACVTEDTAGRIYVGTGRGLDRLDPETGRIKHYTTADGLAQNFVNLAYRARDGALWFGTLNGLSRISPEPETQPAPPPILFDGLRIAGVGYPVSDLGETAIAGIELRPGQNDIQIDFFSLGFRAGEGLRYQYMLEGANADWGAPASQRTVTYANLSPGRYRFLVRAINADGLVSQQPASLSFVILPPVWRRWWFLTLAALALGGAAIMLYRYRVRQLLELERVRTRIATDLHDDIGASLSRVAILSEVLKQQLGARGDGAVRLLTEIAESARASVDSMSDIVWTVDPRRDNLNDVVLRVRQFASDVLEARGIRWEFQVPPEVEKVKLDAERRRHLLLIFKEAINNVVRHSECHFVWLSISLAANRLKAEVHDDGRGFEGPSPERAQANGRGGHGLSNMRARTAELRGECEIATSPGGGTHLTIEFPLN